MVHEYRNPQQDENRRQFAGEVAGMNGSRVGLAWIQGSAEPAHQEVVLPTRPAETRRLRRAYVGVAF
jgi:hypothetical protein